MSKLWKNFALSEKIIRKRYLLHFVVLLFIVFNVINLGNIGLIDWDEGVFALQGRWIETIGGEGKPFNFQTPPLFQILIALLFNLVGAKDFILPLLSIIFSVLTIYLIFYLVKMLYSIEEGVYAVIIFVCTEIFLFFSKSGLSEATFLFLFIASIFFFMKGIKFNKTNDFLLAGIFTTLALYTKYSALPLLLMFFLTGFLCRKNIRKSWFILSIVMPIVLYCPYFYIFVKFAQIPQIGTRHISILGINHIKFLIYLFTFAPIPLLFSFIYAIFSFKEIKKWDSYIFFYILIFFFILGFYYPYFRLIYPVIPLFSIIAARFIVQTRRYKSYILAVSVLISFLLGIETIGYASDIPEKVSVLTNYYIQENDIKYVYAVAPPNIYFYTHGSIAVPSNHPWLSIGKKFPVLLEKKKIIYSDSNELMSENKILLIHATVLDSIKQKNLELYDSGILLSSIEFKDAPVYYKDIYNPKRNCKQIYEIYLFDSSILGDKIDNLWTIGFNRQVEVIVQE